ncbi:TRAP transporter small permease [Pseudooceanicola onchidii]|uniref:TRAP transporter small permease n=1 Tax=Pseudooceanicola onchidii TaxID=2562279 RepID=UPI0010AB0087|nr:TRAP transporter small permease [Pseudooceanicola onchidii]
MGRKTPPTMRRLDGLTRALDRAALGLTVIGGICLIAILGVVTLGVVLRYVFNAPLLGGNEIVQLTAVALVMSALPYCTTKCDHVAVDVFDPWLGPWGRYAGDLLSRAISALVLGLLCRRAGIKALDALEWGDATNMLKMPIWPFYAILAAGTGLCALVFVIQGLAIAMRGPE